LKFFDFAVCDDEWGVSQRPPAQPEDFLWVKAKPTKGSRPTEEEGRSVFERRCRKKKPGKKIQFQTGGFNAFSFQR
jgi:hypothetical protein